MAHLHLRLQQVVEELDAELQGRGFRLVAGHALWRRRLATGAEYISVNIYPDDEQGGWIEPFLGLAVDRVEVIVDAYLGRRTGVASNMTLVAGATRWPQARLSRLPVHEEADVLEASNQILRWLTTARAELAKQFFTRFLTAQGVQEDIELTALDKLLNSDHPLANCFQSHELHRALRGITVASLLRRHDVQAVLDFHRQRLQGSGYWDVYADEVLKLTSSFQHELE